ncbi:hypothetical protein L0Z42_25395 [Burkholderia multivorans]|uniref:hypothetical protein n=1 Tax=Burkholderia multivorans TaxID=87883 RepID=UPI002018C43F|nr:hypothetical protein [Burkholderia multivorans]MCO1373835.1 hypothetical protein [Burkholderia multivorans]MCO1454910.1 hypothetical protein [Burkholderia multivorans]MCO1469461.1 hypothetical protein [Burkholderia multivorans]UQO18980.1 hypothetical protein L0Z02_22725 [Burkholderia multivorans]UQO82076.1 hypothetical protein L0Y86_06515 [Burkholderia multivorans]
MIQCAEEFIALRDSRIKDEYDRAATDEASVSVWRDVIVRFPDYRKWVAHNKTVPVEILAELCQFEAEVRRFVAVKRKLSRELFELLAKDPDPVVRQGVASNKKAPISIIIGLMQDEDESVVSVARYNFENR